MQRRRVIYAPAAQNDLIGIASWLTRQTSPDVARRFVSRIRQHIRKLEYASERGTIRDETRAIRVIGILPTVGIAFSVKEDAVTIHRILHNGQNWTTD